MATITIQPMEVVRTMTGGPPYVGALPEGALQTYRVGAVLTLDANGFVVEGTGNEDRIVGVALVAGSNTAANGSVKTKFAVANGDNIFIANLNSTSALVDVGRAHQVVKSGNFWVVDKAAATGGANAANRRCIIQELDSRDLLGDTNARVLFTFHPAARALTYTS